MRTTRLVSWMTDNLEYVRKIWGDSLEAAKAEGRQMAKPKATNNTHYYRKMADFVVPLDHDERVREDYKSLKNPKKYVKAMETRCRE